MRIASTLDYTNKAPSVVALGCFDGLHLGHRADIGEARRIADTLGCDLTVWTFEEPPKNFFAPHSISLITSQNEKKEEMRRLGVDLLVCVPFDQRIQALSAEAFFEEILLKRLKATHLVCGYNYSFGAGGRGNPALLETLCQKAGISLTTIPPVLRNGVAVSSSEIRRAIEEGRLSDATELLGRPYSLTAPVVDGRKLGRTLGFPTLNQRFFRGALIPRHGVYLTRTTYDPQTPPIFGITNVGNRPTVGGHHLVAETHLFDFEGSLYGKEITVEFLEFLRDEVPFESVEALAEQVHRDMDRAKQIIASRF